MYTLSSPARVVWEITCQCNLRCRHCSLSTGSAANGELTTENSIRLARHLCDIRVLQVVLSGGEPLMRPDWLTIAKVLVQGGITVALNTNGLLVSKETAETIKKEGIAVVTLSIDGANAKTHDDFRGKQGAWVRTIQAIDYLVSVGLDITVTCVLHRYNMEEALDLILLLKNMGVGGVKFMRMHPIGRGNEIYDNYDIPFDHYKTLVNTLLAEKKKWGIDFNVMLGDNFGNKYLEQNAEGRFETGMCEAARYKCVIASDGSVRPCEFMVGEEIIAGNVMKDSLQEIWQMSDIFHYLRTNEMYQSCHVCEKPCPGKCPACAIYLGSIRGPDPTCPIMLYSRSKEEDS